MPTIPSAGDSQNQTYWYMRMKLGKNPSPDNKGVDEFGDFTVGLWQPGEPKGLVGIFWGGWRIGDILPDNQDLKNGFAQAIDCNKITLSNLQAPNRTANSCHLAANKGSPPRELEKKDLNVPLAFFKEVQSTHGVVVSYKLKKIVDGRELEEIWLARGTIDGGFYDVEHPADQKFNGLMTREYFKCRPVINKREFLLSELPSVFRLLRGTGQGTLQRILAYREIVKLLFEHDTAHQICDSMKGYDGAKLLDVLCDRQWEMVCAEWLRATRYREMRLLLGVGGTLESFDIVGVIDDNERIIAQCKNSNDKPAKGVLEKLLNTLDDPDDTKTKHRYLFFRGVDGVEPSQHGRVWVVGGAVIARWLDQKDMRGYRSALASL